MTRSISVRQKCGAPLPAERKNENAAPQGRPLFEGNNRGLSAARSNQSSNVKNNLPPLLFRCSAKPGAKSLIGLNQSKTLGGARIGQATTTGEKPSTRGRRTLARDSTSSVAFRY
jgi:hypothetical protein